MSEAIAERIRLPSTARRPIIESLLAISKNTRAMAASKLRKIDVHIGQDELLLNLSEDEAIGVSLLAARASVRPSTISKSVDRLVAKGWLLRIVNGHDARRTLVMITEAGLEVQFATRRIRNELEKEITRGVPAEQSDQMAEALETVEDLLRQRLAKIR